MVDWQHHESHFYIIRSMEKVQNLVDMGFSRSQAEHALQMTSNDVEKAIGFLLGEISETNLVEIANKNDIPNIDELKDNQSTTYKSSNDSITFPPTTDSNSELDMASHTNPDNMIEAPKLPERSNTASSFSQVGEEYIENQPGQSYVDYNSKSVSYDSEDSDIESILPPVSTREEDEPIVILSPNFDKYSNWIPPIIQSFCQIDEFKYKLKRPLNNSLGRQLYNLGEEIDNLQHNYTLNDIILENEDTLDFDEFIHKIYDALSLVYKQEYDDDFLDKLTKSNVESVSETENGNAENAQAISLFPIENDIKSSNIYDSFNDMFWGKNLETLGDIQLTHVGDIFTILYIGEYGDYYPKPIELQEVFYPEVYLDKLVPKLKTKHEKFMKLNETKVKLTTKLMSSTIFQGKKISNFLSQTTEFIKDEQVLNDLNKLNDKLTNEKSRLNEEITSLMKDIDETNVKNSKNHIGEQLRPYKLILVILNEYDYYYFIKKLNKWIHVRTSKKLDFVQEFVDFDSIASRIYELSRKVTISPGLIYCSVEKLEQDYVPSDDDNRKEAAWKLKYGPVAGQPEVNNQNTPPEANSLTSLNDTNSANVSESIDLKEDPNNDENNLISLD